MDGETDAISPKSNLPSSSPLSSSDTNADVEMDTLFELRVKLLTKLNKKDSYDFNGVTNQIISLAGEDNIEAVIDNKHYCSIFFRNSLSREKIGKNIMADKLTFQTEIYPPKDPSFKEPPKILSTRLRLLGLNPSWKLTKIESTLMEKMPFYIKDSAYFETLKNHRKIKNGNLTFFIHGIKTIAPFSHLRIEDQDVKVRHPKAKGPDAQTAKKLLKIMEEEEKIQASKTQNLTQPHSQQNSNQSQNSKPSQPPLPTEKKEKSKSKTKKKDKEKEKEKGKGNELGQEKDKEVEKDLEKPNEPNDPNEPNEPNEHKEPKEPIRPEEEDTLMGWTTPSTKKRRNSEGSPKSNHVDFLALFKQPSPSTFRPKKKERKNKKHDPEELRKLSNQFDLLYDQE